MVPETCQEPRGDMGDYWVILLGTPGLQVPRDSHEPLSGKVINLSHLS